MNASEEVLPRWIKVPVNESRSSAGAYLLASHTDADWARYGKWCVFREHLVSSGGSIDITDERVLRSLSFNLSFSLQKMLEFIEDLESCGLVEREDGIVFNAEIVQSIQNYRNQVERNQRNGSKGGRPRIKAN